MEKEIKYYAGIGSRSTPEDILEVMSDIAIFMARKGYVLRSGGAAGADSAFEAGCDSVDGEKQIFLPWKNFNNKSSEFILDEMDFRNEALRVAEEFHPKWRYLTRPVKKLMGRNSFQILGPDCKTKSNIVIFYAEEDSNGNPIGGTGQAIRIAIANSIKVINLYRPEILEKIKSKMEI